ncbi:hypothetical protein [Clostridium celatum]|uniref:Uncharacterized protein n=1 Tax=Clostridium celatum DSM 1785 TaxID=545697 RepID=L1QEU0_9CLOT|nr:hypothetical protein [Clostridium celatum]EKY26195.1 hypothetical protein HMPREF0216_02234 [Clostridium celatum DSM 1785]MCE9654334.1 hypothetical protein [Clostridium celatum]MDU3721940.1 hypothetical protein [Clostridium celatum]MDU6295262.1 hypothetical protein [Clostridium celatum]MDY3358962.1 hypothetical protein [Clostridium celatum]
MSIIPSFQYLLVMPNGDVKGFDDVEIAKGYINIYYDKKVHNSKYIFELNDLTDSSDQFFNTICQNLGAGEGECKVYNTLDIIEKIQEELVFDEEKEEVISKLMSSQINFNIYDYRVDNIFNDVEALDILEPYGEFFK